VEVSSADYVAPATAPTPNTVTITITPAADPTRKTQLTIQVQTGPSVGLSPVTVTVAANHRVTLTAQIAGTSNVNLNWFVNGIPGGKLDRRADLPGRTESLPNGHWCSGVAGGLRSTRRDSLTQSSDRHGKECRRSNATGILTNYGDQSRARQRSTGGTQLSRRWRCKDFTATVLGTSNQAVVWQVQGSGCAGTGTCGILRRPELHGANSGADAGRHPSSCDQQR